MSTDRDIEAKVERWLSEDAPPMPDHVLEAVRVAVPRTGQVRGADRFDVWAWTRPFGRVALAAAAVVLLVLAAPVGFELLRSIGPSGPPVGPGTSASPPTMTPEPTPTLVPTSSPEPKPSPEPAPSAEPTSEPPSTSDPFTGTWSTIDIDGSLMKVSFSGTGVARDVAMVDLRATVCGGGTWTGAGPGTVDGDSIFVEGSASCVDGEKNVNFTPTWTYDGSSRTLQDPDGLRWTRGELMEAFGGVWQATDSDGSAMTLGFSGSGLTRDVEYFDELATGECDPAVSYTLTGTGTIGTVSGQGRLITVDFFGGCTGKPGASFPDRTIEYVVATDTLVDGAGTIWHRP
jgi:hypothetical protein